MREDVRALIAKPKREFHDVLGAKLRHRREALGITQGELAEMAGANRKYVCRLEAGAGWRLYIMTTNVMTVLRNLEIRVATFGQSS